MHSKLPHRTRMQRSLCCVRRMKRLLVCRSIVRTFDAHPDTHHGLGHSHYTGGPVNKALTILTFTLQSTQQAISSEWSPPLTRAWRICGPPTTCDDRKVPTVPVTPALVRRPTRTLFPCRKPQLMRLRAFLGWLSG